ncbi:class II fructose-bisphosphate aldolase [Ruminococcus gauvreauii]|uniref:Class II fructose-bisphosphate aldolase n=1 Tax=Ruminococcus gauvreauii TaxID=438033 RepID=A0ABY5VKE2_9FIRM|nr:class II fructose-bisphosphate aldolase [Ruminococcus gauvreauii]UWP61020.1 class II fructose-bisphosphate aldolase [Ruminococcus gauvreauii]
MLASPKVMMADAQKKGYAVPAFNYYNLDVLFAVLEAAEEEDAPVIVQPYSAYVPFLHHEVLAKASLEAIAQSRTCAYLHLDHATDYELIMRCIGSDYTSVMVDGSALPLDENIALTKSVVKVAKSAGIYTEAELGRIFRVGVDDDQMDDGDETARVEDCVRMVEETGVCSLAPAVGTAHGVYTKPPKINFERIREIRAAVDVPLVLHGGSGTPDEMIREAISCGISKINVGTELKYAWSGAMKEMFNKGEKEPRVCSAYAREQVKEVAKKKLRLFGTSGHHRDIVEQGGLL